MKRFLRLTSTFSLALILWAAGVATAAIIGVWAVSSMITSSSDRNVLNSAQVNAALTSNASNSPSPSARASAPPSTPANSPQTPSSAPPPVVPYSTGAGTLSGRCNSSAAEILTVTPAQGYWIEDRGDPEDSRTDIQLSNGSSDVKVQLNCSTGTAQWATTDIDHDSED